MGIGNRADDAWNEGASFGCADGSCGCGTSAGGLKGAFARVKGFVGRLLGRSGRDRDGNVRLTKLAKHTG